MEFAGGYARQDTSENLIRFDKLSGWDGVSYTFFAYDGSQLSWRGGRLENVCGDKIVHQ